ncbi:hypothetical protein K505DRAFT_95963, partial [Melanomma pulvis-pyrius CBS 109.77]
PPLTNNHLTPPAQTTKATSATASSASSSPAAPSSSSSRPSTAAKKSRIPSSRKKSEAAAHTPSGTPLTRTRTTGNWAVGGRGLGNTRRRELGGRNRARGRMRIGWIDNYDVAPWRRRGDTLDTRRLGEVVSTHGDDGMELGSDSIRFALPFQKFHARMHIRNQAKKSPIRRHA